jgi:hypothetical protein
MAEDRSLKDIVRVENIIQKTDNELIEMGLISEKLAEKITPKIWSNSLKQLIKT